MRLKLLRWGVLFLSIHAGGVSGQYAQGYFRSPLDIPLLLSGTFAELRNNHFHGGIDIKTEQREGLNVYAVAEGYLARIEVSSKGYGNVIYINHPNGYSTVYAHLQKFNDRVDQYVRAKQYQARRSTIDIELDSLTFPVKKGKVIGLSGNSGSSLGPHLHFEIRETKNDQPINPLLFGFQITDTKAPDLFGIYIYPIQGHVNGSKNVFKITGNQKRKKNRRRKRNRKLKPVLANGKIGIGFRATDGQDFTNNRNGIYETKLFLNEEQIFFAQFNAFRFEQTRYINNYIDYPFYINSRGIRIQKAFIDGVNPLSIIKKTKNNGLVDVKQAETYSFRLTLKDFHGNITEKKFTVIGNSPKEESTKRTKLWLIRHKKENEFSNENITIQFPKGSFYNNFYFDYNKINDTVFQLHHPTTPVHRPFFIKIKNKKIPKELRKNALVARKTGNGWRGLKTKLDENYFYAKSDIFGTYSIIVDTIGPIIEFLPLKNKKAKIKYTTDDQLAFKISDKISEINYFETWIDDKWILSSYDLKNNKVTLDLKREKVKPGNHTLVIQVSDYASNYSSHTFDFEVI